ncbi:keratin, type I cytoskeletal 19-like [Tachysurus vachellii]|uniref:keratin, type I cytoskeletal 19-like n=1 Tax=Tachysurus vachellii TaxID=175792 RepID=UPI00296B1EF2|nr:keratin, type I cytoskeletal 19-like [Tachysurus vachellii]
MPVSLSRSASTSSIAKANFQISGYDMGLNGLSSFGQSIGDDLSIFGNEKWTMQNLNSRLASYLEKVLSLERANGKLEQQIKEFYESRSSTSRKDLSKYYVIIEEFQKQIISRTAEKQQVFEKLDSANLAATDFKIKFESERNMRLAVEADLARLRTILGETELATKNLQMQLSGLEEEMIFLKKSHEEDMHLHRTQQSDTVNVEVDCGPAANLDRELEEMRNQYETLIQNNRKQIEQWFQSKAKTLNTEVLKSHTEIKSSQKAFSDLTKTYQTLEIEIKGIHKQIEILQTDLVQVGVRSSEQLSQLQGNIDRLETELQQITASMQEQAREFELLMDIKMRLELEIQEYRRLLEGEVHGYCITEVDSTQTQTSLTKMAVVETQEIQTAVTETTVVETQETQTAVTETTVVETQETQTAVTETTVVETQAMEEEKHLHQKRVRIIIEKLVDGVVVSTTVEENVQDLPN